MKTEFDSLEQRVIGSFYLTMPEFLPCKTDLCSEQEQENLYNLVRNTIKSLYQQPTLLFSKLNEDYGFPNVFTMAGSNKEHIGDIMRKIYKEFQLFIEQIINIGKQGEFDGETATYSAKLSKRHCNILSMQNVQVADGIIKNNGAPFFNALKWFANLTNMNVRRFETCSFDEAHDYLTPVLAPLCSAEEGACQTIIDWLKDNGYVAAYQLTKYDKNDDCSVSYIKT